MSEDDQKNMGVDLGEFLEFYLLDSQEQIEKLGAGLLQLEKEGNNIALINDLFRSAHSLKGASGTMGFTSIVALTHSAEDLLDRLRQGKIEVSMDMIDVLLEVTDRVKAMLGQVEQHEEINIEYQDLVDEMKAILNGEGGNAKTNNQTDIAPSNDKEASEEFQPLDFLLSEEEKTKIVNAQSLGHGIYQVDIKFDPNTLMKAVRAVMVAQRLDGMGSVVKMLPSLEDLENASYEGASLLVYSDESQREIHEEIMDVSEIAEVAVHVYPAVEMRETKLQETKPGAEEAAKAEVAATAAVVTKEEKQPVNKTSQPAMKVSQTTSAPASSGENHQVHTIRVDTARMDNLINLVGEMVITRTRLVQIGLDLKDQYKMDALVNNLNETNVYLGRLMNDLQESVMRLRMVPIGTVFSRFPRLVRDLARKTDKEIELVLKGEDTELDKTVVEVIGDPLMHLIRNSVDHGIEQPQERLAAGKPEIGQITLDAYHEGNHIAILISDDGEGLDLGKIRKKGIEKGLIGEREELADREIANLIFLPGFSTADKVTDISGRGVGMDVVKKALNNLGGMIDIDTRRGQGTTFTIRLPLTLAIIQALLVEVSEEIYAIPLSSVLETLLVNRKEIKMVGNLPMVQLRGNTLPLISLQEKFDLPTPENPGEEVFVVVVGLGDKALGIIVDGLRGQQEIVIKSLGELLNNLPGIAGATILGDGKVTLILDIGSLIQDILVMRKS
ncbi:chemotaxis protein CheW [Desulfitobacterium sp. AusDCA]|uniref:chemotaxis protein CheW n=1 Tax=Desulfitobacterium sp. AusDCA TaxID=3240383 RepID=UPI003DA78F74